MDGVSPPPMKVGHDLAPQFLEAGCVVFDLSGAFRVNDATFYEKYYGFTHQYPELLEQAAYGLAEWCDNKLKEANLIAVPGCYPTAAQLALKPLIDADLLDLNQWPVINATSGVSGAGRKAAISNSFCEVSLQPYGVFTHRHQPEIATHLGADVIFTPHLGNFPRGILENHYPPPEIGDPRKSRKCYSRRMPINRWCGCMTKAIPALKMSLPLFAISGLLFRASI